MSPGAEFASRRAAARSGGGGVARRSKAGRVKPGSARARICRAAMGLRLSQTERRQYAPNMNSHAFLAAHAPAPVATPAPSIAQTRAALETAGRDLAAIPDAALAKAWRWRDHDVDVRYGLFRVLESVEGATAEIAAVLGATAAKRSAAALRIAPSTIARWALHGRLVGLDDASRGPIGQ